ncbi:MAG: NINE protein [Phycisphaerales bacterium]
MTTPTPNEPTALTSDDHTRSFGAALACWLLIIIGLGGIHRFYLGKWKTGLLWLLTGGLLLIGQILDIFRLPALVERVNEQITPGPDPVE